MKGLQQAEHEAPRTGPDANFSHLDLLNPDVPWILPQQKVPITQRAEDLQHRNLAMTDQKDGIFRYQPVGSFDRDVTHSRSLELQRNEQKRSLVPRPVSMRPHALSVSHSRTPTLRRTSDQQKGMEPPTLNTLRRGRTAHALRPHCPHRHGIPVAAVLTEADWAEEADEPGCGVL